MSMVFEGKCEGEHDMLPCSDDDVNPVMVYSCSECGYTVCENDKEIEKSLSIVTGASGYTFRLFTKTCEDCGK